MWDKPFTDDESDQMIVECSCGKVTRLRLNPSSGVYEAVQPGWVFRSFRWSCGAEGHFPKLDLNLKEVKDE